MRISDWSSDVCSSDLSRRSTSPRSLCIGVGARCSHHALSIETGPAIAYLAVGCSVAWAGGVGETGGAATAPTGAAATPLSSESSRSEEHTSELQSLMRISYAVFCLKKKNKNNTKTIARSEE